MEDHNNVIEELKQQLEMEKQHKLLELALLEFDSKIKPLISEMSYPIFKQYSLIIMNLILEIDLANMQKLQDVWRE